MFNRLTSAEAISHSVKDAFSYDAQGRRISKTVYTGYSAGAYANAVTTNFAYDGTELIAALDSSGNVIQRYQWGQGKAGSIGALLSITDLSNPSDPQVYTPVYDSSGNIVSLLDSTGTVVASYTYSAFGKLTASTGPAAAVCPFGYQTMYRDAETGLSVFPNRYYSPTLGRWMTRDPSGEQGGDNLYAYCENDPINGSDPSGLADTQKTEAEQEIAAINSIGVGEIQPLIDMVWSYTGGNPLLHDITVDPADHHTEAVEPALEQSVWVKGGIWGTHIQDIGHLREQVVNNFEGNGTVDDVSWLKTEAEYCLQMVLKSPPGSPDGKERFNAEICTPAGLDFPDDEYYKTGSPYPMSPVEIASGYYLRSFTAADELAMFLFSRAWVLDSNLRFQEALDAWAKCCFLAPAEPMYPRQAYESVLDALQMRKSGKKHPRGRDRTLKDDVSYANILDYLSPKEAAMAQSIKGHFHQVRQESGNAILAYTEACRLDPDHSDYPADLVRYNCRLQEIEKQAQVKVEVWQKDNAIAPNGNLPTPKAPVPTVAAHELHQPVSIIKPKPDIAAGALNIRAMVWAEEGLKLERKGKLAAAQAAFACGITQTVSDEPLCHVYLHRVVRKEVQASQAPAPFTSLLGKNLENPEDLDPRLKLSPVMQGVIWAERGKVFEIMGRSDEAAHAYMQASILDPKRMATSDVHRTSQKVVNQQWQQKQANTRAQNSNPLPFIPLLTIAAMPAATSHLIFTFPPVTNLEPTTFYPRSK